MSKIRLVKMTQLIRTSCWYTLVKWLYGMRSGPIVGGADLADTGMGTYVLIGYPDVGFVEVFVSPLVRWRAWFGRGAIDVSIAEGEYNVGVDRLVSGPTGSSSSLGSGILAPLKSLKRVRSPHEYFIYVCAMLFQVEARILLDSIMEVAFR